MRNCGQVKTIFGEVLLKVTQGVYVLLKFALLTVGNKNDAVNSLQNQFSCGVVIDLSRNGVELKTGCHPTNLAEVKRHKVKEKCSITFSGDRCQFATM